MSTSTRFSTAARPRSPTCARTAADGDSQSEQSRLRRTGGRFGGQGAPSCSGRKKGSEALRDTSEARDSAIDPYDAHRGPLSPFFESSEKTKRCPSFGSFSEDKLVQICNSNATAFEAGSGGYGYNHNYVGGTWYKYGWSSPLSRIVSTRMREIGSLARTIAFADTAFTCGGSGSIAIEYPFIEPPYFVNGLHKLLEPPTPWRPLP